MYLWYTVALMFDKENGNMLWQEAMHNEIKYLNKHNMSKPGISQTDGGYKML